MMSVVSGVGWLSVNEYVDNLCFKSGNLSRELINGISFLFSPIGNNGGSNQENSL